MSRKYNLHASEDLWKYWQEKDPEYFTEDGLLRPLLVKVKPTRRPRRRSLLASIAEWLHGEYDAKTGDMVLVGSWIYRVARRIEGLVDGLAVVVPNCSCAPGEEANFWQWSRRPEDAKEYGGDDVYFYKKCDPNDSRGPAYWAAMDGTPEPLTSS